MFLGYSNQEWALAIGFIVTFVYLARIERKLDSVLRRLNEIEYRRLHPNG